jgi:hypothetical protein
LFPHMGVIFTVQRGIVPACSVNKAQVASTLPKQERSSAVPMRPVPIPLLVGKKREKKILAVGDSPQKLPEQAGLVIHALPGRECRVIVSSTNSGIADRVGCFPQPEARDYCLRTAS